MPDWLLGAWRCWHRLTDDRPWYGGGLGPMMPGRIPWRAVCDWAAHHGLSEDEHDVLDRLVREMDSEYLDWHAARCQVSVARQERGGRAK